MLSKSTLNIDLVFFFTNTDWRGDVSRLFKVRHNKRSKLALKIDLLMFCFYQSGMQGGSRVCHLNINPVNTGRLLDVLNTPFERFECLKDVLIFYLI